MDETTPLDTVGLPKPKNGKVTVKHNSFSHTNHQDSPKVGSSKAVEITQGNESGPEKVREVLFWPLIRWKNDVRDEVLNDSGVRPRTTMSDISVFKDA